MSNLNLYACTGNVVDEPEIKTGANGKAFGRFRVAVNFGWGDKAGVNFWTCTAFGMQAEKFLPNVHKGSSVYVTGRLEQRKYTDKQGVERFSTDLLVSDMGFAGAKGGGGGDDRPRAGRPVRGQKPPAAQDEDWGDEPRAEDPDWVNEK